MKHLIRERLPVAALCFALALATGCGSGGNPESVLADANDSNLKRLCNLYVAYQATYGWVGPPDEETFREFIASLSPAQLQRVGVDPGSLDGLFVSERDGQPFAIRYSVRGSSRGSTEPVVFESVGVGGRRLVARLDNFQDEMSDAEADALLSSQR